MYRPTYRRTSTTCRLTLEVMSCPGVCLKEVYTEFNRRCETFNHFSLTGRCIWGMCPKQNAIYIFIYLCIQCQKRQCCISMLRTHHIHNTSFYINYIVSH